MSTQHTELDADDKVNGADVCRNLIQRGFHICHAFLKPYDGQEYLDAAAHFGFKQKSMYPHRVASFASTISRGIEAVKRSGVHYDLIIVTRIDVVDGLKVNRDPQNNWYERRNNIGVIGLRYNHTIILSYHTNMLSNNSKHHTRIVS